ncbi:hypothetical protein HNY73_016966 [Argiope bruennichi]|uniref:Uncharacterized protein n=1 Tax=Argiope bruennichi TaxID=94029 RepID=A0A8T0EK43_ARGBR|nr:hypothetical protein HNY73_016966 [Argiope bruennichi]
MLVTDLIPDKVATLAKQPDENEARGPSPLIWRKGKLDIEEIKTSEKFIFKETQREAFSEKEKLNLRIVKDSEGLLRIETRIASRKYLETFIFSVLLPHKHQMIEKLIMSKHVQLEHAGAQAPMSCIRESFWIIKSRKTVPGVIRKCTKFSARIPLPEDKSAKGSLRQKNDGTGWG